VSVDSFSCALLFIRGSSRLFFCIFGVSSNNGKDTAFNWNIACITLAIIINIKLNWGAGCGRLLPNSLL
jgi:hypothetical protein